MNAPHWLIRLGTGFTVVLISLPITVKAQSSSCLPGDAASFPGQVTVVERNQLGEQTAGDRNLERILVKLVPGLSERGSRNLTLRGRPIQVFIDGVPVSHGDPLLSALDPEMVEKVEVIPGFSPLCP